MENNNKVTSIIIQLENGEQLKISGNGNISPESVFDGECQSKIIREAWQIFTNVALH